MSKNGKCVSTMSASKRGSTILGCGRRGLIVAIISMLVLLASPYVRVAAQEPAPPAPGSTGPAGPVCSRDLNDTLDLIKQGRRLKEPQSLLPFIVNPFTSTLLCDWHFSGEPDGCDENAHLYLPAVNPLTTSNVGRVKSCESVCVDATAFESFVAEMLPLIGVKVLLFTHRECLPQVHKSDLTDVVRSHPSIWHWFAQNPVYAEDEKYSAFPYGIRPTMLPEFGDAFLAYHRGSKQKNSTIEHLHVTPTHPSRHKLVARRAAVGQGYVDHQLFYDKIAATRFLISPHGDRPDCYRHWEALGLGAIPIANIDRALYGPLFGNDMLYVDDADKMIELLDDPSELASRYHAPQSERVITKYWTRKVDEERRKCGDGG